MLANELGYTIRVITTFIQLNIVCDASSGV